MIGEEEKMKYEKGERKRQGHRGKRECLEKDEQLCYMYVCLCCYFECERCSGFKHAFVQL